MEDVCSGESQECLADVFQASTTVCLDADGPCDVAEMCTGSISDCSTDEFEFSTHICRNSADFGDV